MFENYEMKQVESYKKMLLSMTSDIRVILIKFADRLHNLRTLSFYHRQNKPSLHRRRLRFMRRLLTDSDYHCKTELERSFFKYLDRKAYDELGEKPKDKKKERKVHKEIYRAH